MFYSKRSNVPIGIFFFIKLQKDLTVSISRKEHRSNEINTWLTQQILPPVTNVTRNRTLNYKGLFARGFKLLNFISVVIQLYVKGPKSFLGLCFLFSYSKHGQITSFKKHQCSWNPLHKYPAILFSHKIFT